MALNWSTTSKEAVGHGIKCLVYGPAGIGKTRLCGTAPSPLIISAEQGLLTLRNSDHPVLIVSTAQDVRDALAWCKTDAVKSGIQTVCLDSISEIAEKILADEKTKTKDPRQAYGELATQTIQLVKDFRDLPGLNVVVVAKATVATDPITGAPKSQPTSPGQQVGPALPYLFDEVFYAGTGRTAEGQKYWYLQTAASENADAKDRSGVLDGIEYPDLTHIFSKINPPVTAET